MAEPIRFSSTKKQEQTFDILTTLFRVVLLRIQTFTTLNYSVGVARAD